MFKGMGAGALISLEDYLATDYSPDREFVDGVVVECWASSQDRTRLLPIAIAPVELRSTGQARRPTPPKIRLGIEEIFHGL